MSYPKVVYRHASEEPFELSDGMLVPGISRATIDRIASTKPAWADFECTDIEGSPLRGNPAHTEVTWTCTLGDVDVAQDCIYDRGTGEKLSESAPYVRSWAEHFSDPDVCKTHALHLKEASELLAKVVAHASEPRK